LCSHCVIFLSEDIHLPLYTDTFPASWIILLVRLFGKEAV
jgi:hypothetical protein